MPYTIFLSYSHEDERSARQVVKALEDAGYSVWWDGLLEGGVRFSHVTEEALENARAVVVLWSKTSVGSHWVHDEATRGRDAGRLVPLSLDGSMPPLGFGQFQSIDVSGVLNKPDSEPMQKMFRSVAALHDGEEPVPRQPGKLEPSISRRALLLGSAGVALLGAAGVAIWQRDFLFGAAQSGNSVAVLPFANLSGAAEQRYFSEGLTSEIRAQLARNTLLQVAGQTSSENVSDSKSDDKSIASELGVSYLLTGNVQMAGERIKIATELTAGKTGLSKWAEVYERPLTDIFAVQTEIATAVTSALTTAIGRQGDEQDNAQIGGTQNVAAFDAYLRGRALYEAGIDEKSDREALAYFDRAIGLDSGYAGAYAARSRSLAVIGNLYADHEERVRLYNDAVLAAQKATTLAPKFAEGFQRWALRSPPESST